MAKFDRIARVAAPERCRARLAVLIIAPALVAVSCSDNDSATPSSATADDSRTTTFPTTSTTSTTTTTETTETTSTTSSTSAPTGQSVEEEIVARYIGYWDARFAANSGTPNPDDPALREFATGDQLETVMNETRDNLDQGLAFRPAANPSDIQRVNVVELDGDHAVVQECVVADGVIIRRANGEVINDEVATHNVRGELVRVDGAWKVSSARLIQRWEGVAGCALVS